MNKTQLQKLRKGLPTYFYDTLQERTGRPRMAIYDALHGKKFDKDILNEAIKLKKEVEAEEEQAKEELVKKLNS